MVILPYLNIEGPDLQERKAGSISTIFKPLLYLYVIHSALLIMYEKLAFVAVTNASLTNGQAAQWFTILWYYFVLGENIDISLIRNQNTLYNIYIYHSYK